MTTPPVLPAVVRPTFSDIDAIAALIAEAFTPLPAAAWLVPDADHRTRVLRDQFTILIEHALFFGHIDLLADRTAVAVWVHRLGPVPPPPHYEQRLQAACGPYTNRFRHLDHLFEARHPLEPHHHLALLAVTADAQRSGRGTALLAHHHAALDAIGVPAYLEASSSDSRDLYARHGYQVRRHFDLPDGTTFWPMWRRPTPT
jgi:GNAT superfamily N-acetyltransferase